jgi:glycosyltransferase involved in cell wall biosynthesis
MTANKTKGDKPAILIMVENLPVPPDRRVWQECQALRDAGYEVVVVSPKMKSFVKPYEVIDGVHIYRHKITEGRGILGFFAEYITALAGETFLAWKAWFKHRFRLIHMCNPPDLMFAVAWPFKLLGVRVIFDVHDLWPEMFEAKFRKRNLFYWCVRLAQRLNYACADVVLATNETNRRAALENGKKDPSRVFLVRTAPKIPESNLPANPALKKGRRFLIGYIGVMGSADGVDLLIKTASILVHDFGRKDIQFILLGDGPEFGDLVALRDRLQLTDFVDMPGWADNNTLVPVLKTIDLGVTCDVPNAYNHSCTMNKVLEYMTFGKPQVSFDLVETRASALEAGLYVNEVSARKLAESIIALLDEPAKREAMGRRGYERLHHELNWDKSVAELLRAYETVLR